MSVAQLILVSLLVLSTPLLASQDEARRLAEQGEIQSLEKLVRSANQMVAGRVIEAELKHRKDQLLYEIEILDERGVVWEFVFDARNGKLLKKLKEE
ncbi:MAG: PepSY domain-containing protein [Gammaproteobacteria bacterium]|nr:PepSY domain-containing protein [Gammaproteobacteria bacterium]